MGWLDQYYRINKAAGVAVHFHKDGTAEIHACVLEAKGNDLIFAGKFPALKDFQAVAKAVTIKTPVALNISGRGVLIKQGDIPEGADTIGFSALFPNFNEADFYAQHFVSGRKKYMAIIRKNELKLLLDQFSAVNLNVLALSLGPFAVHTVQEQLNFYDATLHFAHHEVTRDQQKNWLTYRYNEAKEADFPIKIDNETIAPELVIPYAAALQLILSEKMEAILAEADEIDSARKEVLETTKLKANGFILLAAFFIILLVNAMLYASLSNSNNRLQEQVSLFAQSSSNREQLTAQLEQKKAMIKTLGWDGGLHKSTLIDQVASLMPSALHLTKLSVTPIDPEASRNQRTTVFLDRTIRIEGISAQIIPVNEWLARIKSRRWVKDAQLESYNWNNELNTGVFIIIIHY